MLIRMIRDKGEFKTGNSYNLTEETAKPLLTEGFCVRLKEKPVFTDIAPELITAEEKETSANKRKK